MIFEEPEKIPAGGCFESENIEVEGENSPETSTLNSDEMEQNLAHETNQEPITEDVLKTDKNNNQMNEFINSLNPEKLELLKRLLAEDEPLESVNSEVVKSGCEEIEAV